MNKLIIKLIEYYQKRISPNTNPHCKYKPTCSQYAKECFQKFNFFIALFYTIFRIIRCNPFSKGGYDPSPLNFMQKQFLLMFSIVDVTIL